MDGSSQSVSATIRNRSGKIKISIFELNSILEDTRMQVIGGIKGTIDIWELALIPSLINNSETWTDISEDDIDILEDIQRLFFRIILQVPVSCPKPAFCWETGTLQMRYRIYERKLNFAKYLQLMDPNSLAYKIYAEQKRLKFPGLIQECLQIAKELKIETELENNTISIFKFKKNC